MISGLHEQLADIQRRDWSTEEIASVTHEDQFVGYGVDLLVETGSYVCVAAHLLPGHGKGWDRNQAIVGGHVVRLFKLISALLDQTCQRRREISFVITRLAYETIVNLTYLIRFSSDDLFDSYVRYSLRHERKLHDEITKNINERGGVKLPIEDRMLASIERTTERSEVTLASINSKKPRNWGDKSTYEKADATGLGGAYLAVFGGGSHSVHGNWNDLLEYQLEHTGEGFIPRAEWMRPRPQVLLTVAKLSVEVSREYFEYFGGAHLLNLVDAKLKNLWERIGKIDAAHEAFLSAKQSQRNGATAS